ncbi:hypothetical protein, partial [Nocardiopsis sp. LOL_012]|uniref:hypothetical protein n=1 Tax=Nocardiopsis sp. LOL_012 TaxID=3345409 RepID=UPI003A8496C6
RREEALAPAHEAADLYRTLAGQAPAADLYRTLAGQAPAAYLPDLAMALNNLANRLAEVGRREEALAPAHE